MKKQTPVTYEHLGWALVFIITLAMVMFSGIGIMETFGISEEAIIPPGSNNWGLVRSITCYNLDGTGPMETCPAKIECHSEPNTNSNATRIICPMWPPQ